MVTSEWSESRASLARESVRSLVVPLDVSRAATQFACVHEAVSILFRSFFFDSLRILVVFCALVDTNWDRHYSDEERWDEHADVQGPPKDDSIGHEGVQKVGVAKERDSRWITSLTGQRVHQEDNWVWEAHQRRQKHLLRWHLQKWGFWAM